MEGRGRKQHRDPWRLIRRSTVSVVCVCLSQFALYLISLLFSSCNIIPLSFLSVIVLIGMAIIGRICKKLFGLRGSAPAFVFANLFFIWSVYLLFIHKAVSFLLDTVFHAELIMLHFGLYRILSSDPGFVKCGPLTNNEANLEGSELPSSDICEASASAESSLLLQRVRYCKHCDAHVKGFDHHCPAFGNCIGRNNHLLFMILLTGFIIAEACYIVGASQFATSRTPDSSGWTETLATSTMIFSLLQVLWQAVFLGWHIYCVCFNIKTDEWMALTSFTVLYIWFPVVFTIHWKHYPEFQYTADPQPGETVTSMRFKNPYDKGIWLNLKEFIEAKG